MADSNGAAAQRYGSDLVVDWLYDAGIRQVAINPGATIRGLHDSLVRHPGIETVLALHEEIAVGIAHGYWKATGRPMAVFVHDLVGLQHASMALFNASVDRAAMVVVGGVGPRDESQRRPWLDWIHTATEHTSLVRDLTKVALEPSSLVGVRDGLTRALRAATSSPEGPVYLAIDVALQEGAVSDTDPRQPLTMLEPVMPRPSPDSVAAVTSLLQQADHPVLVVDRPARSARHGVVRLAEALGASVVDLGGGFCFPSGHWADQSDARAATLAAADVIVTLEVRDPAWVLSDVDTGTRAKTWHPRPDATVVVVGVNELRDQNYVVLDELLPTATYVVADAGLFVDAVVAKVSPRPAEELAVRRAELQATHDDGRQASVRAAQAHAAETPVHPAHLATLVGEAISDGPWVLANGLLQGWPRRLWEFGDEAEFLGRSGGEGLGYGVPASLGAALAHRDTDHLVVDIQADGDMMYTSSALWTAAHCGLPLLIVVHDNGTYGKDELHQREIATLRGRSADVVPRGIHINEPPIDFAQLANAQGVEGIGPCEDPDTTAAALRRAAQTVRTERRPVLVHVRCSS
jgi:benzoylformate decarboxylase/acetolactate synthase-1/2/3 large subunit